MKNYKDFEKEYIGSSDIASLILAGYRECEGLTLHKLNFGEDNSYSAYIVHGNDVEIGSHYTEVIRFQSWLKIYDDDGLAKRFNGKEIIVYRAAQMGCIIQIIPE